MQRRLRGGNPANAWMLMSISTRERLRLRLAILVSNWGKARSSLLRSSHFPPNVHNLAQCRFQLCPLRDTLCARWSTAGECSSRKYHLPTIDDLEERLPQSRRCGRMNKFQLFKVNLPDSEREATEMLLRLDDCHGRVD